jgi:hypothetical protein
MTFRTRALAAAGALVFAGAGLTAPVASAGQPQRIETAGGFASFSDVDEILRVNDKRAEGWRVVAQLRLRDGAVPISEVVDRDGANGEPNSNDLEIREGTKLSLRLCYEERLNTGAHVIVSCSGWQNAVA